MYANGHLHPSWLRKYNLPRLSPHDRINYCVMVTNYDSNLEELKLTSLKKVY